MCVCCKEAGLRLLIVKYLTPAFLLKLYSENELIGHFNLLLNRTNFHKIVFHILERKCAGSKC